MNGRWIIIGALVVASNLLAAATAAQLACAKRQTIVSTLAANHQEVPLSIGVAANGTVIKVFASVSGSFTIVNTRPDGLSYLIAVGENWQAVAAKKADIKT